MNVSLQELHYLKKVFEGGSREISKDQFIQLVGRVVAKTSDRHKVRIPGSDDSATRPPWRTHLPGCPTPHTRNRF